MIMVRANLGPACVQIARQRVSLGLFVMGMLLLGSCQSLGTAASPSSSAEHQDQAAPPLAPHPQPTPLAAWTQAWLTSEPCHIPCWYGITPGGTTTEAALAILKTLPFIDQGSLHTSRIAGEEEWRWRWLWPIRGTGKFAQKEDVVIKLHLDVDEEIPLDHIIASLGPPLVWTYTDTGLNHQAEITIPVRYGISLRWPTFGLASLGVNAINPPSLGPHMLFRNEITLLSPTELLHLGGKTWQGYYGYEWYRN
jgi:hypothetical protein